MRKMWKLLPIIFILFLPFKTLAKVSLERQQVPKHALSIKIPKGFILMDEKSKRLKYPSMRDSNEKVIFTDERGKVNIIISAGTVSMFPEQLDMFTDSLVKLMPNYQPSLQKVTVDGKDARIIDFISRAMDTDIHNKMLTTSFNGKAVIVSFNTTVDEWEQYKDVSTDILLSLKFE
ncbi:hypothetical protein [Xenorhabdus thuongxuanensis]|uniref:Uncharacterized protein n=1 Tax=Xenorhabdus thuongxuanensis TaxID=1873484 RepID=A0A1Q5TYX6_9GAMM|nr:hypothetical protein [Xenorhabdus thuongxuanensis]OKP05424.1 hypothetical protein Xentx_02463 [Xenorhabdus thuongxuanensis]